MEYKYFHLSSQLFDEWFESSGITKLFFLFNAFVGTYYLENT